MVSTSLDIVEDLLLHVASQDPRWFRVQGLGIRVQGLGFRRSCWQGFRVSGLRPKFKLGMKRVPFSGLEGLGSEPKPSKRTSSFLHSPMIEPLAAAPA